MAHIQSFSQSVMAASLKLHRETLCPPFINSYLVVFTNTNKKYKNTNELICFQGWDWDKNPVLVLLL